MTIDVFHKDFTERGIFVLERDTLFIALGEKGQARPTSIQRGDGVCLLVMKRANPKTDRGKEAKDKDEAKNASLLVDAVLESVDANNAVLTADLGENQATAMQMLMSEVITNKQSAKPAEVDKVFKFVYAFNNPPSWWTFRCGRTPKS
jgi:NhaP-type Na+/H+ and K+/H+ antiporter